MPSPTIATIDFAGSALRGYPIEVGVALWHREVDQFRVWSTLIRPIAPRGKMPSSIEQALIRFGSYEPSRPRRIEHRLS